MKTLLPKQIEEGAEIQSPNRTGIPIQSGQGVRRSSGQHYNSVQVPYTSEKPAPQAAAGAAQPQLDDKKKESVETADTRTASTDVQEAPVGARFPVPPPKISVPPEFLPFGESAAWYGSVHDGTVGSVYFEHGRLRLFHVHGPAVEKVRGSVVRYLIKVNDGLNKDETRSAFETAKDELIQRHKDHAYVPSTDPISIGNCFVYALSGKDPFPSIPPEMGKGSRLFEIHLSGGRYQGHHKSRGGIERLDAKWTDPGQESALNLSGLFCAVELAEEITKKMEQYFRKYGYKKTIPPDQAVEQIQKVINSIVVPPEGTHADAASSAVISQRAAIASNMKKRFTADVIENYLEQARAEVIPDLNKMAQKFGVSLGNEALKVSGVMPVEPLDPARDSKV